MSEGEVIRSPATGRGRAPHVRTAAPAATGSYGPSWDHHRFLGAVRQASELGPRPTRRVVRATLETLAETLLPEEATRLGGRLPAELAPFVGAGPAAQRMETLSREEFLRRVMVRTGASEEDRCALAAAIEAVIAVTTTATGVALPAGPFNTQGPLRQAGPHGGGAAVA